MTDTILEIPIAAIVGSRLPCTSTNQGPSAKAVVRPRAKAVQRSLDALT